MKIKIRELEIPITNPFLHDLLGRIYAEALIQFIATIDEPFVLALNSTWGTGKTTFVKMCSNLMQSEGIKTIYFNAWEKDFSNDPLIPLITEIETIISQIQNTQRNKVCLK